MKGFFVFLIAMGNICAFAQWNGATDYSGSIYRTGNVGIGINTVPTKKFEIRGSLDENFVFIRQDKNSGGTSDLFLLRDDRGYGGINSGTTFKIESWKGLNQQGGTLANFLTIDNGVSKSRFFIDNHTGNVGIGTASPTSTLDVNGGGKVGNVVASPNYEDHLVVRTDGNVAYEGGQIFTNSDISTAWGMKMTASYCNTANPKFRMGVVNLGSPNTFTHDYLFFDNGEVGFGTASPSSRIHILTPNSKLMKFERTGSNVFGFELTGSSFGLYDYNTLKYQWRTNGGNILLAESGGNVGIGTTSTDAKLTVKGDIHTQEVKVDLNGSVAPDYVFAPDYNLLPLSEVESYIKANKHLPEVPSAKQMEAEGLNLKEMNLLLLKKVEELTLHLIEMEKEKNKVQNQNDVLSTQVDKLSSDIAEIKALLKK